MKKIIFIVLGFLGIITSCGNSTKQNEESTIDSVLNARVSVFSKKLPLEEGAFTMEKCTYDGKTVNIILRANEGYDDATIPEILKWLPALKLNQISQLDTLMIRRLIELNQPLTYSVYKGDSLVKKFANTAIQLKGRAASYGMLE